MAKLKKGFPAPAPEPIDIPLSLLEEEEKDEPPRPKRKGLHPETLKALARFAELGELKLKEEE